MTAASEPLVIFTPSGRRGRFASGTTVLDAARGLGVDIDSVCGGRGICGRCQVQQSVGSFAKHGIESRTEHLSPFSGAEVEYRDRRGLEPARRLSCVASLRGDVIIDVPPESQVYRQVVRKDLDIRDFHVDPVVRLHYVQVAEPELASPSGDLRRLQEALETEWGLTDLETDLHVIRDLQPALQVGRWAVTVGVHDRRTISAVWPGLHEKAYGVAIDIGSTTIAGHLADLSDGAVLASNGAMNPQIRFGEDLMSRVSYAMMHPEGAAEMTAAVRKALNRLLAGLATEAGIRSDEILEL
ncbi:MAG: drug:proton antiporter, partial [Chloroflexi bacterium]|nr:drug:proton antiporter [Chloroflexota bacterium]